MKERKEIRKKYVKEFFMDGFTTSRGRQRFICSLAVSEQLTELEEDLGGKEMSDRVKKVRKAVSVH